MYTVSGKQTQTMKKTKSEEQKIEQAGGVIEHHVFEKETSLPKR